MGLIISGYQGIGKSSAADPLEGIIDFESSLFKENGISRNDDWCFTYVRQAISLANQGFIPLLSSHKEVRNALVDYAKERDGHVVTIAPVPWIKSAWIDRLEKRYAEDQTSKNYIALVNAQDHLDEDVVNMASEPYFSHIYISDTDEYDLKQIIRGLKTYFQNPKRLLHTSHLFL